ncbi:MAG: penicillin-binding protein 2 [Candidatus Omnitrophica bacterium]|jgi:penicillin-binding protein 2|nr:penicillin-binding protein 2 [Candidatus Omnitrophota bacterium]
MRIKVFNSLAIVVFLFLALSLLNTQVVQGRKYRDLSDKNCIRLIPQSGSRGNILDRRGNILVGNKISYDLVILPQDVQEPAATLLALSKIIDVSFTDLKKRFRSGYIGPTAPVTLLSNIDIKKAVAVEEMKFDLDGVMIQPSTLRAYPYGRLAAHAIGYINEIDRWRLTKLADYGYKTRDMVGFGGVEEKYDYYLRQEDGGLSVEVDHRGRFMRVLGYRPGQSGKDLQLTLDIRIQKIVEDKLSGRKGCVVIMDPDSGQIFALASYPDFDPNVFIRKSKRLIEDLVSDPGSPFVNRAISGLYPAGSTFKPAVAAAGLDTLKINRNTSFKCSGDIEIGQRQFNCMHVHGQQNVVQALAHSCNIFFYRTGLLVGPQQIHDYAVRLGLSGPTGIELPYEYGGFIPDPFWKKIYRFQNWYNGDTANLSIGQGELLVTPLNMCRMVAVFANKGKLVTPYLIKAIDGQDVSSSHRKISSAHLKANTVSIIRQGLREAVSDPSGTAGALARLPVEVSGKTGTAQAPGGAAHGWFIGFWPSKQPKYVICVFLERAGAGTASVGLCADIIRSMAFEGLAEGAG